MRSVVIHGHFYQPPRENPWLEEVECEPSAAPFHDWNERIEKECYRAVVAARLVDGERRITGIMNALTRMSFNFGPTLLEWMERQAPATYDAVLQADHESLQRFGHGNALAQPYHHAILPLSTRRDKVTEVRWGIRDFRRRFGRDPEGMWLPETAVDDETLDVLAEQGIRFTVLAPHQGTPLPPAGQPGVYRTRKGRSIALFFYDGGISHEVAFGPLIKSAPTWAGRILAEASRHDDGLVAIATDGETYGHHHPFGEMALAKVLELLDAQQGIRVENFAAWLDRQPAVHEVSIVQPTSWSCVHGVERWRSECGCKIAPHRPSQQKWRTPLRQAIEWLADQLHAVFQRDGAGLGDVWAARDAYDPVTACLPDGDPDPRSRELLEMERNALRIFTSCAWFFDDLAGLESVQVLKYAARAIELAGSQAPVLETGFLERLSEAKSNDAAAGNGRELYLARVKPAVPTAARIAAGLAGLSEVGANPQGEVPQAFHAELGSVISGHHEVRLFHRRTGATMDFDIECHWAHRHECEFSVLPGRFHLTLGDLWDRHQALLRTWRARHITRLALTAEERERLASGEVGLRDLAPRVLYQAILEIGRGGREPTVERALHVVDLLEFLDLPIPFEAQTALARIRVGLEPNELGLEHLSARLGFAQ